MFFKDFLTDQIECLPKKPSTKYLTGLIYRSLWSLTYRWETKYNVWSMPKKYERRADTGNISVTTSTKIKVQ